jgi:glycosyltransferase involved in cell wall biosynthesis
MTNLTKEVIFIGALPPPVGGLSVMNRAIVTHLSNLVRTHVFNASSNRTWQHILLLPKFITIMLFRGRHIVALYMGLHAGVRQYADLIYIAVALLFGKPCFVHHHAFGYITKPKLSLKLIAKWTPRRITHVALCDEMKEGLSRAYKIRSEDIHVCSNAAVLKFTSRDEVHLRPIRKLTIGYLANICEEKGIFEYLALIRLLASLNVAVDAVVAGPVGVNISTRFFEELRETFGCRYLGPVYGADKVQFYRQIDALVFPTKYFNEAEPVVLLEAASYGVTCISTPRGCITSMLAPGLGTVVPEDRFVERAALIIKELSNLSDDEHAKRRVDLRMNFEQLCKAKSTQLEVLLNRILRRTRI